MKRWKKQFFSCCMSGARELSRKQQKTNRCQNDNGDNCTEKHARPQVLCRRPRYSQHLAAAVRRVYLLHNPPPMCLVWPRQQQKHGHLLSRLGPSFVVSDPGGGLHGDDERRRAQIWNQKIKWVSGRRPRVVCFAVVVGATKIQK